MGLREGVGACVLIHIWTKGEVSAPLNRFKPSSKIFYWPFQGGTSFVDHLCYLCFVFVSWSISELLPGRVAQSVACLALQMRFWLQIQGSRVRSRSGPILSWRLIMKLFLRSFSSLPLIHWGRVVVYCKRKYVQELLVNRLFKPAQEKVWLGELTVPQWP